MKTTIQRLASCLITLCLIAGSIHILGYVVRPTDTDGTYDQVESFHSLPEHSLEVILYGSSHTLLGVNPMEMYRSYGIGAYNYGWHFQKLNTTTLFLQDSLLEQTPKLVLIDTYFCNMILNNVDMNAEIYYSRYLHNKEAQKDYLNQCFGEDFSRYLSFYVPLIAFHDNWSSLSLQSFLPLSSDGTQRKNMGYSPTDWSEPVTLSDPAAFYQEPLSPAAIAELDKIVSICKQKNIEILFFTIPYQGFYEYGNAMAEYANSQGYPYLDLFQYIDEIGLDAQADFSDDTHLNTSGANKVANFLGEYIVNHYDVTDMRTIEGNLWEQTLQNR